jgi:hypothetical protein
MDLFEEIDKSKEDFPKVHSIKKEVDKYELNYYQIFSIIIFVVCFFLGIIFGNLFATCETTSYYYSEVCIATEFNFSLMIGIWFISLIISTVLFAIGHIIALLGQINQKLSKFKS